MDKVQIIKIFEVPLSLIEFNTAVTLVESLIRKRKSKFVALANVNTLNYAYQNKKYRQILLSADIVLRDGTGVKWAAKKMGADPKYNFVGTDFIPRFCSATSSKKYRIYLLGARPGIAESAATKLQRLAPGLLIAGYQHGYFDKAEESWIINEISNSNSDILLVALGNPNQEMWIAKNLHKLNVPLSIGVGALFDYMSGHVPRAPKWMLDTGIEWLFRLLIEPRRLWRRYLLGNPLFMLRVYRQIFFSQHKSSKERSII
jgi:N-acetylglucosaminyldiphosphoundecaprenol N-acetyl-beta-D-mannosaminyltransferase